MDTRRKISKSEFQNEQFYKLPKILFYPEFKELSNDARILYSLLRDRHQLSMKNEWIDKDDNIFLIYSRIEMGQMLNKSLKTITKCVSELKKYKLLDEEKQGLNRANHIYVLEVVLESIASDSNSTNPVNKGTRNIFASRGENSSSSDTNNLRSNNTNTINTDIINNQSILDNKSIKQKDNIIDLVKIDENQIISELESTNSIPNDYINSISKMEIAIKHFSSWEEKQLSGFTDTLEKDCYQLFVDTVVEMATTTSTQSYNKTSVTAPDILQKINTCLFDDPINSLDWFLESTISKYISRIREFKISSPKPYMKSCIWNNFSTYKIEWQIYFNQNYIYESPSDYGSLGVIS